MLPVAFSVQVGLSSCHLCLVNLCLTPIKNCVRRRHACQACGQSGEFPVRVNFLGTVTFLVCKR